MSRQPGFVLTLAVLVALAASPARAGVECPRIVRIQPSTALYCVDDPVPVAAAACSECVDDLQFEWDGSRIAIDVTWRPGACSADCVTDRTFTGSIVVESGRHAAEAYVRSVNGDPSSACTGPLGKYFFDVTGLCPPDPRNRTPYFDRWERGEYGAEHVCPGQETLLRLFGQFPNNCVSLAGIDVIREPGDAIANVRVYYSLDECVPQPCPGEPREWTAETKLPGADPGRDGMRIDLYAIFETCVLPPDTAWIGTQFGEWRIPDVCEPVPPGLLPYVKDVQVLPVGGANSVGEGESFSVRIAGEFPDDCTQLGSVEVVSPPADIGGPPGLRVVYVTPGAPRPCVVRPDPWSITVALPGLPSGNYELPLEGMRNSHLYGRASVPFSVGPCRSGPCAAALDFAMSPTVPNPFSSATRFEISLPSAAALDVGVYDLQGRRLSTLFDGMAPAGRHALQWDGRDANGTSLRGGVYFNTGSK